MPTAKADNAFAVWITGLPASGKSAVTSQLAQLLRKTGVEVEILESDALRRFFSAESSYEDIGREYFYASISFIAQSLTSRGVCVIVDATANRRAYRERARRMIPRFVEVFVACPLEICIRRDPKGLYRQALADPNNRMPGLGTPYEPPKQPDVLIHGDVDAPAASALRIVDTLIAKGFVPKGGGDTRPQG